MDHRALALRFDDLYRREATTVTAQLRRCGVPPPDIDDAIQDVFMVLLRRLAELSEQPDAAWLRGVARHVSRSYRRSARRRGFVSCGQCTQLEATVQDAAAVAADDALSRDQLRDVVSRALARLDTKKREVMVLTHLEELTAEQVAQRVAASPHTVASRLRAARREVRKTLRQSGPLDACA